MYFLKPRNAEKSDGSFLYYQMVGLGFPTHSLSDQTTIVADSVANAKGESAPHTQHDRIAKTTRWMDN